MRKLIPIVLTLVALVGAFIAYFSLQGKYGMNSHDSTKVDSFPTQGPDNGVIVKSGSGAWSKQYDKDGNLYYQFKCDYYDPQPDGTVKVTHPLIEFFLSGGQVLEIEGANGSVRFGQAADKGVLNNPPSEPPRYGNLQHVTVKLFNSVDRQHADDPDMTMQMLNAQFDDDTYRLFTEEYQDESGAVHHADEVPVTVSARDYEFVGSGLVLYWNDLDKRLKSLEIAHGKYLTLSSTSRFLSGSAPESTPPPAPAAPQIDTGSVGAAAPAPAVVAVTPNPGPVDASRQRYTATFFDNVRIEQAESRIDAKEMEVDFSTKGDSAPGPKSTPPQPSSPAPSPPTSAPSAAPATHPSAEPIRITWTGPMRMVPTDLTTAPPLPGGKAIVRLMGTPVKVHEQSEGSDERVDLQCNALEYRTEDSSAHLLGNVLILQSRPSGPASTISGQSLEFSQVTHIARFLGPGETKFPDPNDAKSVLTSSWQQSCTVHLYDTREGQTQIEMADLEGDVAAQDEPRFHLTAGKNLELRFDRLEGTDAGQATPPLRLISANGDVHCTMKEATEQTRRISGEHLQLFRDRGPDGKLYARTVACDGNVRAETEEQSLSAEVLQVDLSPTKPEKRRTAMAGTSPQELGDIGAGDLSLDRLVASRSVVITGKDGAAANADELVVQMIDDHPHIQLSGSPRKPAMVKNSNSLLTGTTIRVSPHDQAAEIEGAGTFDGVSQPKDPREKPRPMHLVWSKSATLDGKTNRVVVDGDVSGVAQDPDGGAQSAKCARIVAMLADVAPTTQPATKPASDESYADGADFMKDKQVEVVSLVPGASDANPTTQPTAEVESKETDTNGVMTRQYNLWSQTDIVYDLVARRVSIDGPGNILAQETAAATTQPTGDGGTEIGGAGNTAIGWNKRFIYDEAKDAAVIEGGVKVVHRGIGAKSETVELSDATIIQAEFEAGGHENSAAATPPPEPRLRQVTAIGPMTILTQDKTIRCGEINFDPIAQLLTCTPGVRDKVTIVDNNTLDSGSCDEAEFNLKTNELKKLTNVTGQGR
jgi:lipopolysaccharide export system protein LptA